MMIKTQYCIRCGQQLDLDFGKRWKRCKCPACKLKFKYRMNKDGSWSYDFRVREEELFKEVEDGGALDGAV